MGNLGSPCLGYAGLNELRAPGMGPHLNGPEVWPQVLYVVIMVLEWIDKDSKLGAHTTYVHTYYALVNMSGRPKGHESYRRTPVET